MKVLFNLIHPEDADEYLLRRYSAEWAVMIGGDVEENYVADLAARRARQAAEDARQRFPEEWNETLIPRSSVVYYIQFGDRVKIGFTTNLEKRLTALPHDEVLATEPGGQVTERRRHEEFETYRITGEWFEMGDELVDHINELRRREYAANRTPKPMRRYVPHRV
ncbi:GIY-YIG nuclease family protein [Nonomuraea purpurea]|uniref:GIY-YIG nuclease family protein n=1 Tax=Nonomuraea purpurea TaxID=1849276 RepID=A0ABV8G194_9ACTN